MQRKTANLRIGRVAAPGARYFITACTAHRRPTFASASAARIARDALLRLVADGDVPWLAATIMPDHVHLLFELGDRLVLDRIQAKVKGLVSRSVAVADPIWQENAFEHRLRPDEDSEDYAFYVFMNPYRARLLSMDTTWPWWVCSEPARFRFLDALKDGGFRPAEWLGRAETVASQIVSGE